MSDTKFPPDSSKDWQALQKQYWNAWTDLTKNATIAPNASTPWHEGLEQWSRLFGTAGKQSDAAERMLASAKGYIALMQSMLGAAGPGAAAGGTAHAWTEAMRNGLNMPGLDANFFDNPLAKALRDISGNGVQGFDQLAAGAMPWLQQMEQEGKSWLRAPAFGYGREHQEQQQKMALAISEFQAAIKRYNALILQSSQRGFAILEDKLAERGEPGRQIDSVRALYDLWVDSAEQAYAEVALTDEFRKVYGDVVNAQMRVRSHLQQEVERIGVDLGMPTRSELNSVHKRLHDLRRELRNRGESSEGSSDARDEQIATLRAEVEALKRQVVKTVSTTNAPVKRAPTSKRAAPRSARSVVAAAPNESRNQKASIASFQDAIAHMRDQAKVSKKKKKSSKAVAAQPTRASRPPKTGTKRSGASS